MTFSRPGSLRWVVVCFSVCFPLFLQLAYAQQQPPAAPAQQQKKNNPFEAVPQGPEPPKPVPAKPVPGTPEPAKPGAPPAATPTPAPAVSSDRPPEDIVESVTFRGQRRITQELLKATVFTKEGDPLDEDAIFRDEIALWNTNRFNDLHVEREPGAKGWIIRFVLVERPVIRTFDFDGLKSIQKSEVLDRFKEKKVGLSAESMYDPNKIQHARNVLQEFLAERGRQFATVDAELHQVPPSALTVMFKVDEGPKVKVNKITFEGNHVFTQRVLLRPMVNSHAIGIPHSIFFESLFNKTYDSSKLDEDQERLSGFYQDQGYFTAHVTGATVKVVDTGGGHFRLPLFWSNKPGKGADINIALEEGRLYHLNSLKVEGMKFIKTDVLVRRALQMQDGDVFSTAKLRKGFEDLRKIYGTFGFMDFVEDPDPVAVPNTDKIDLTLTFDEGKQYFVRRIDFSGNTTTRDKVIRRELQIDEGDIYNTNLWDLSILRLNQLGYFETLKAEEATQVTKDTKTDTVDLTLKVRERAKNSIQLQGGVSGIAGSFVGFSYSTNNFLGLGETLGLNTQLGTRTANATLSFTEPYFLDRPLQVGGTIFVQRFNYNQAREASILSGANLIPLYNTLGTQNLLNYTTNSHGFTLFASYPLKRSFARLGLSYGFTIQTVNTLTTAAQEYYDNLNFLNFNGPNALSGITSSTIIPSYTYNSVDSPINPSRGRSVSFSTGFAGSVLGGNVNEVNPVLDVRYFRHGLKPGHVIGMHLSARYLTGYGGKVAPPFNRFYMGGENDIRGFEIWGISPIAYVPSSGQVNVLNNDGSPRQQKIIDPTSGAISLANVTQTIPTYQLVFPGGDMSTYANFEYRIPIFGPVTAALFFDGGVNRVTDTNQLQENPSHITQLNSQFPEAAFKNKAVIAAGTQAFRSSTGLEFQVLMPVVNAPFRVYFAYNPNTVRENLQPPIAADRSYFPNAATFNNAIATFGQPLPYFERITMFRFTVGRTF
jgi:outer membrane protein insertion porin family